MRHINKLVIKYKNLIICSIFILTIIYLLIYIRPTTIYSDENYTMALIKHSYKEIPQLDSLDVHPPLYYLILKLFLQITTFWSQYLPIKIIFGRLLTIISSLITLVFLYKVLKILKIQNNVVLSYSLFIILPVVLGPSFSYQQMTNLRMYALAGLFISIEFYYLLKFDIRSNNDCLLIVMIAASLASYTHYYSLIFSGLLLLLYLIKYLLRHNVKKSLKMITIILLLIISYLPWIKSLISQISTPKTYWINYFFMTKQIFLFLLCMFAFMYPILKYYRITKNALFKEQMLLIISVSLITLVFSIIFGVINHPIFIIRYMYPMLIIYEFIGINTIIKLIKIDKIQPLYYMFIFIFLLFNLSYSSLYQLSHFIYPSINAVNNYNKWNNNSKRHIYISDHDLTINNYSDFNLSDLIYSKNKKRFSVPKEMIKNDGIQSNIAYKKVFNSEVSNIKIK